MARYTPVRRTQNQPKTSASTPAIAGAKRSATSIGEPAYLTRRAAAYAPPPKKAACPNETMPPGPIAK